MVRPSLPKSSSRAKISWLLPVLVSTHDRLIGFKKLEKIELIIECRHLEPRL